MNECIGHQNNHLTIKKKGLDKYASYKEEGGE
jgi:hypothetical protein